MKTELIIFDVDGTLAKAYTLDLLPKVKDFFDLVFQQDCPDRPKIVIATNQGGVGMRYWMERNNFGDPEHYPTEESIAGRMQALVSALGGGADLPVYTSFNYLNRQGHWAPVPPDRRDDPRWSQGWRKPAPGMLLQAMRDAGVGPKQTLFVGDSQDDQDAARAAGCAFAAADTFFEREWSSCTGLADFQKEQAPGV